MVKEKVAEKPIKKEAPKKETPKVEEPVNKDAEKKKDKKKKVKEEKPQVPEKKIFQAPKEDSTSKVASGFQDDLPFEVVSKRV